MNARSRLMDKWEAETGKGQTTQEIREYLMDALSNTLEQVDELGLMELEGSYGTKED
ncbi:MAG: hypothetical protein LYZ70_04210 [Nitrososphaerales archaeon]|nr:hypothetical protein [Nitrososphaerales archaeon]